MITEQLIKTHEMITLLHFKTVVLFWEAENRILGSSLRMRSLSKRGAGGGYVPKNPSYRHALILNWKQEQLEYFIHHNDIVNIAVHRRADYRHTSVLGREGVKGEG